MNIDKNDVINSIIEGITSLLSIPVDTIPNIDLYMDQVTNFMETNLASHKRYADDKILTKTMINNYVKDGILPAPEKKKYSKEHLLILIGIYYLKDILSIKDVGAIMKPLNERYFHNEDGLNVADIYDTLWTMKSDHLDNMHEHLQKEYTYASSLYDQAPSEEREPLRNLTFICMLAMDVYTKKQIIESMLDNLVLDKPE